MPFDYQRLLDLIPLAVGVMKPGSMEGAAMMRGYARAQQQAQEDQLRRRQVTNQEALTQSEIANRAADNARQDAALRLQEQSARIGRLLQFGNAMGQRGEQLAEGAAAEPPEPEDQPLGAQSQLRLESLGLAKAFEVPPSALAGTLPNMTGKIAEHRTARATARAKRAKELYADLEKVYGQEAMAKGHMVLHAGEPFGDLTPAQLRAEFVPPAFETTPDMARADGSMKDVPVQPFIKPDTARNLQSKEMMRSGKRVVVNFEPDTGKYFDLQGLPITDITPIPPAGTAINPAQQQELTDQAQQLVDGNLTPSMLSKRSSSYNTILAEANRLSKEQTGQPINFVKLQTQFAAAQRFAASQNSTQATRFRSLAGSVVNTINEVRDLADELKQGGVQLFNRARRGSVLQVYGNTPQSETAARYVAAVNTLKEEFAGLIQGGYAPTESAFALANQQINGDYGVKDLNAAVTEVQRLIQYRLSAFEHLWPLGASQQESSSDILPPGVTVRRLP